MAEQPGNFFFPFNSCFLSRLFEEGSQAASILPSPASTSGGNSQSTTPPQQFQITRWPNSHENAGVLILSDEEDDSDSDSDHD